MLICVLLQNTLYISMSDLITMHLKFDTKSLKFIYKVITVN